MRQYHLGNIKSLATRKKLYQIKVAKKQKGFTLIELMVVIMIVAIFAAIAIPSYRQYVVKNAEDEVKAQMQQIQIELERWRAASLSYKDFEPKIGVVSDGSTDDGKPIYGYVDPKKTEIYVPLLVKSFDTSKVEIDASSPRYIITLVDASNNETLVSSTSEIKPSVARSWKMLAIPNKNGSIGYNGDAFILTSTGKRCQKPFIKNAEVDITANCEATDKVW